MSPAPDLALTSAGGPRPARNRRRLLAAGAVGTVVVVVAGWWATHPPGLPAPSGTRTATTATYVPIYLGAFTLPADTHRTLHLLTATTDVEGNGAAEATAKVCHDGSISVTTDPEPFCHGLENSDGADLGPGDTLVVEVNSDFAGTATIDHVGLTFRDGLRWGSADVGPRITVTILPKAR